MISLEELEILLKKHRKENDSDTPDFILAEFLNNVLNAFSKAVEQREAWYKK